MTIRRRVALQITLVMLGAFVVLTAAACWTTLATTEDALRRDRKNLLAPALRERAVERGLLTAPSAGAFLTSLRAAQHETELPLVAATFVDAAGRPAFAGGRERAEPAVLGDLADPERVDPEAGLYEARVRWGEARDPGGEVPVRGRAVLQFALPAPPPVGAIVRQTLQTHGAVFALFTALLVVSTYVMLDRGVLRRLAVLATASRPVAGRDYGGRVPPSRTRDEIGHLLHAFNQMTAEVREYHTELERRVAEATDKIRAAERRMVLTQRLASMGTLAAGIAHEVNNPIGGMLNAARRLQDAVPEGKPRTYVELLLEGLERVQRTVKQVLTFTPRTVNPQPVHLPDVARRAVEFARHRLTQRGVELRDALGEDLPGIVGEPSELQQVFLNLIINAADATPAGGQITLQGRGMPSAVEIAVTDTGSGMTEEQVSRAFDIFYTTKPQGEGTGLGLPIVHNIVQGHGGSIEILSKPGAGTTVRLRFPLPDAPGGDSRRLAAAETGEPPAIAGG